MRQVMVRKISFVKSKIAILLFFIFLFPFINVFADEKIDYKKLDLNYEESNRIVLNPERGLYRTAYTYCNREKCSDVKVPARREIVHLRIGLGGFTKANNNEKDFDFTDSMLSSLESILKKFRENDNGVILRFAYDDFDGLENKEPEDIEQVLRHIEQLRDIIKEYDDVIFNIETSLIGKWGEQHSSDIVTLNNIAKIIDKYLEITPSNIPISVRRPRYYAYWKKIEYDDLYKDEALDDKSVRVGVFNDGYLGSETDLGTFYYHPTLGYRKNEITWLNKQATHTFYGGEVVKSRSSNGIQYNSGDYASIEMFETHTSYLNSDWNEEVMDMWKDEKYTKDDPVYQNESNFLYIINHLGYRFILKDSKYAVSDKLYLNGIIENVGASNVIRDKNTQIILKNGDEEHVYDVFLDVKKIKSREKYTYSFGLPLDNLNKKYDVYIRIVSSENKDDYPYNNSISFANNVSYWNEELHANYIGTVDVNKEEVVSSYNQSYYLLLILIVPVSYLIYKGVKRHTDKSQE